MVLVNIPLIRSKADLLRRKSKPFCHKGKIILVKLPAEKLIATPEVAIGSEETNLGGWRPQQLRCLHGRLREGKPPLAFLARENRRRIKYPFLLGAENCDNRH